MPSHFTGDRRQIYTNSGASALRLWLRLSGYQKGSKIALPLLTCEKVAQAIVAEGLTPVYVDVSPDSLVCTAQDYQETFKQSGAQAVIAVSMWGYPVDPSLFLDDILPRKDVIHDCCLSFGSTINGVRDGMQSDASFFSFGPGKPLCLGYGGAFSFKETRFQKSILEPFTIYPFSDRLKSGFLTAVKSCFFNRHLYSLAYKFHRAKPGRMSPTPIEKLAVLPEQFDHLVSKYSLQVKTNQKLAKINEQQIKEQLIDLGYGLIEPSPDLRWNYWMYPVKLPEQMNKAQLISKGLSAGFEFSTPYLQTIQMAKKYWHYSGECPVSEKLVERMVLLPALYTLNERDLECLIDVLTC